MQREARPRARQRAVDVRPHRRRCASASCTSGSRRTRRSRTCRRCAPTERRRRVHLLRRPGRRRPAHAHDRPHRGRPRRGRRQLRRRSSALRKDDVGRVIGATVEADGETFDVDARVVVNAAGVWSDDVRALDEGDAPDVDPAGQGHPHHRAVGKVRNDIAAIVPVPKDRRSVFVVPWGDLTYIGTTDTDYDGPLDDPQCTPDDVDYLLDAMNVVDRRAADRGRHRRHVGRAAAARRGRQRRRDAPPTCRGGTRCARRASGVITVTGGKLTTYRRMAADTVDAVGEDARARRQARHQAAAARSAPTSRTAPRPVAGRRASTTTWRRRYGTERRGPARPRARRPVAGRAARARAAVPAGRGGVRGAGRDGDARSTTCSPAAPAPACWPRRDVGRGARTSRS